MNTAAIVQNLKRATHAVALVFAFLWLVATSAVDQPTRDCFTGLGSSATLDVTLGPADSSTGSAYPSCQGVDGLVAGAVLTIDLSTAPRMMVVTDTCQSYTLQSLAGVPGLAPGNQSLGIVTTSYDLTETSAPFSSPTVPDCTGTWAFALRPSTAPADGQLLSPFDAGSGQPWVLERSLAVTQGQSCGGLFAADKQVTCIDTFAINGIANGSP
jgi:hypothetical protein